MLTGRLTAVALLLAGMSFALPAWSQRGGGARGGGGFSARSSAPAHAAFAPATHFGYTGAGGAAYARGLPGFRTGSVYANRRPVYPGRGRYRTAYAIPYGYSGIYSYYPGYIDPGFYDDFDQPVDNGPAYAAPPYSADNGSAPDPGAYPYLPPMQQGSSYRPQYQPSAAPPPAEAQPVTLIFKDGRPPEQIHNYMLTRTTLYVQDSPRREIAVADLDIPATAQENKPAGIVFALPETR